MSEATYSTSTAAKKLSISQHYLRRLLESGLVDCDQTPGGHWRVFASEIDRLLQEGVPPLPTPPAHRPNPARPAPIRPAASPTSPAAEPDESPDVRQARDSVTITEQRLRRRRLELEGEQLEDQFEERARARQTEDDEAARRQAQASAAQVRRQWEEGKIEWALSELPRDCPADIRLNVKDRVREALKDLTPTSAKGIVDQVVRAATETALEPYYDAKRIVEAIEAAVQTLPWDARYQDSPWELEARTAARAAVLKLSDSQDAATLRAAARVAVAPIARKFQHEDLVQEMLRFERFWQIGTATEAERKAALKDASAALKALPVGTGREDMEEAKREALQPHEKALRRRLREAQREAEAREIAEKGIRHLKHHLFVSFDWDSHEERMETEEELREQLRPRLEELAQAGEITAADVVEYVETWTDERLEEEAEDPEEED